MMKKILSVSFFIILGFLAMASLAHSGKVTLGWNRNQESDLAGYKIYYGQSSRQYTISVKITSPDITICTISDLADGQVYYFAATAYNNDLIESDYSNEVFCTVGLLTTTSTSTTSAAPTTTSSSIPTTSSSTSVIPTTTTTVLPTTSIVATTIPTTTSIEHATTTTAVSGNELLYSTGFETLDGWNNGVYYVGGYTKLEVTTEQAYSGGTSLKAYGGTYQSARKTIVGLRSGDKVIFSAWVFSTSANPINYRLNGTSKTDWTQSNLVSNGVWKYFELRKTLTSLDISLDLNVYMTKSPSDVLYVDSVKLEREN